MRVVRQENTITMLHGGPRGRRKAHVREHAAYRDRSYAKTCEDGVQIRSVEPVISLLPNDPLMWLRRKGQLPPWLKRLIGGTGRTVILEEDHGRMGRPRLCKQKSDRRNEQLMSWHSFKSRNKSILDVDDDQGINCINRY